jgi:sugar lactone lactonase YvrE
MGRIAVRAVAGIFVLWGGFLSLATAAPTVTGYRLDTLVQPSLFHGIHGMKVGPDGKLYATDIYGFTLWQIDIQTGEAKAFVDYPNGMADDLAFAPDGTMAWTSPTQVFGRKPDGTVYKIADNLPGVNGIGFDHSGRLFVTQIGPPESGYNSLVELDPSGKAPPRVLMTNAGGINGFRIDANDVLWGPQTTKSQGRGNIVRIDLNTLAVKVITTGFTAPTGVDLDSKGNIYVVDLVDGTITRVDPQTGTKTLVKQLDPWLDNLTLSPDDKIYVSDSADNTIWEIDSKTGETRAVRQGLLALPGGVAVVPEKDGERIYVADQFSFKSVDGKTGQVTDYGHRLGKPLVSGNSIRFSQGKLLLSSIYGGVSIIDPATNAVIRRIGDVSGPYDAIALPNGDIIVAEYDKNRLTRIAPNDTHSVLADGIEGPVGLVLGEKNALYVTSSIAGTVLRVDADTGQKTVIAKDLHQPEGIDRAPDGKLYVVEGNGGNILRLDPSNGKHMVIASGLPIGIIPPPGIKAIAALEPTIMLPRSPAWIPNGIAVGKGGVLYVSADKIGALYKLTPTGAHK